MKTKLYKTKLFWVKTFTVVAAVTAVAIPMGLRAANFNSAADPNVLPMISGFSSLPQSTLNENDAKAIDINNNATQAQKNEGAAFYQYPFSATTLMTLHYAGGVRDAYIAANSAGQVSLVNNLLAQENYDESQSSFLEPEWSSSDNAKDAFKYPRPYCRLPQIHPLDGSGCPNTYGFPSGHSKIAWNEGVGLAVMLPEVAPQILARTAEISNGRVVVGAHYPLDVMAGRAMATRMIAYRLHDDTWKAKFDAARTQLRAAIETQCGMTITACIAAKPPTMSKTDSLTYEKDKLTYGFTRIGAAGQSFQAPDYSYELLDYAFPTKTQAEKETLLTSTAIDSGYPLDTTGTSAGTANIGWTRLDLAKALSSVDSSAPTISLSVAGYPGPLRRTVNLDAAVTDDVGVTKVEFYRDTVLINTDTTSPFSYSWDTTSVRDGNHPIVAVAYDAAGSSTASQILDANVVNEDPTGPSVSFTAPATYDISGTTSISVNASDSDGISKVQFYMAKGDQTTLLSTDTTAPYSYAWDTTAVADGEYTIWAIAFDALNNIGSTSSVIKQVTNTPDTTPQVSITSPTSQAVVSGTVPINVNATDNTGVTKVEFYNDDVPMTLMSTDTTAPYSYNWDSTTSPDGVRRIYAVAYDTENNTRGAEVFVMVNNVPDSTPPTVSITDPLNNAVVSDITWISTNATDNIGVTRVEFYVGTTMIDSTPYSPYQMDWTTYHFDDGIYDLTVKAYDADNNVTTSAPIRVIVNNDGTPPDLTAPATSITSPADGATISGTTSVDATASDNTDVAWVEFYYGTTLLSTDTTAPYSYAWDTTTVANGAYALTTKAFDAATNSTTSAVVNVTVSNAAPDTTAPTVSMTNPVASAIVYGTASSLTATASDNVGVTKVEFYDGTTLLNTDTTSPYSYNWDTTSTANGSRSLTAKAYDAAGNVTTSAAVAVTVDNAAPTVSVTAPTAGQTLSGTATVNATATDTHSSVSKVEFYYGTTLIATDTTSPYSAAWDTTTVANASYTLTAKAFDVVNNSTTSAAVNVTVNNTTPDTTAPTTSITAPTNNATVSGTTTITANAADNVGVSKVEFYYGTTLLSTDTTAPYSYAWDTTTVANGAYALTTKAFDAANNNTTSSVVNVTVSNSAPTGDTTPPTTSITAPTNNATISGTATIAANASDDVGVSRVEFYSGSTLLSTDTTSPYSYGWDTTTVTNGAYALTAKAFDAANNNTTSSVVNVTVNNPDTTTPNTSITAPTNNATISGTATIAATAADNVGVARVEFYQGTTLLSTDLTSPYTYDWDTTSVTNGAYALTVKAFDAANNNTTSSVVNVTVSNMPTNQTLTFSLSNPDGTTNTSVKLTSTTCNTLQQSGVASAIPSTLAADKVVSAFGFTVGCSSAGGQVAVSADLGKAFTISNLKVYKDQADGSVKDITADVVISDQIVSGQIHTFVQYSIADGAAGDSDGQANSSITDPVYVLDMSTPATDPSGTGNSTNTTTTPAAGTNAALANTGLAQTPIIATASLAMIVGMAGMGARALRKARR